MHFASFVLKNLLRRPARTTLTVVGLAVAVGSMVALLAVSTNAERAVGESFDRRRVDLVVTQAGRSSGLNSDFREYFVDETRKLDGVQAVAAAVVNLVDVTRPGGSTDQVMIQGWPADHFGFEDLELVSGRRLAPGDRRKTMLGSTLAANLGKRVGDTVVFGKPDATNPDNVYEVVGVFKSFVVFEDGSAVVSLADGREVTGMQVTGFSVRVNKPAPDSPAEVEAVRQKIEALRDPADPSVRLAAQTPGSYVASVSQLRTTRAISWLVSVIAVSIGVIGVVNTMAMSVLERTREIGVLRAIGWPPGRVVRMVLGESALIALTAGVVGTAGAEVGTRLLTLSPTANGFVEGGVPLEVAAAGVLATVLIGLVGGAYPALRAARLRPTEAIRHD